MRVMLAGQMGRDAAIARRLAAEGTELHLAAEFENPSLLEAAISSEGKFYKVDSVRNPRAIGELAFRIKPDIFITHDDEALAQGVVDAVQSRAPGVLCASPDRASSRMEWDKFYTREIMNELDHEFGTSFNPAHKPVTSPDELRAASKHFQDIGIAEVAIKPRNLSGGKGSKVMGPHLKDYDEAEVYGRKVLANDDQHGLLVEPRMYGIEFTSMGITDGRTLIVPRPTVDYPYRQDGDTGPGTGGMGSFMAGEADNFRLLKEENDAQPESIMHAFLGALARRGHDFKGIEYASFFRTPEGLKLTEFNARGGDPELINTIDSLGDGVSWTDIVAASAKQELHPDMVRFSGLASLVIYLVSPDYAYEGRPARQYEFNLDEAVIEQAGCRVYFGSAKQMGKQRYRTVGASRTVALATQAETLPLARNKLHQAIAAGVDGPLEFRRDIGAPDYLQLLRIS